MKSFLKPHDLNLGRPGKQVAERTRCTKTDVLNTHFTSLEKRYQNLLLNSARIFNLDEIGLSSEKYCRGASRKNLF